MYSLLLADLLHILLLASLVFGVIVREASGKRHGRSKDILLSP
ncbi:hypothetical protein BVRB_3g053780 [Beta vulgaris subsp. vulgaris]|nr:hypothetical protein BVRB_3g053780 [Beta vulgaris subsp. vulgaris]